MVEIIKEALVRRPDVERATGLSRSAIYDRLDPKSPRHDSTFPRPVNVGSGASVRWVASEVAGWVESRIASRAAA